MKVKAFLLIGLATVLFGIINPPSVIAQVVINEFSSGSSDDWVEIYSSGDADISGWILKDSTSTVKTVSAGTFIVASSSAYFVIDAGNRLNKDTDDIKLYKSDETTLVDRVAYGPGELVCSAEGNQTIGRNPDGTGAFVRFDAATKGGINNSSVIYCPTPTPSPTPSPTQTPTTTPASTPTKTPTSTPSPAKTATSTPKATATSKPVSSPEDQIPEAGGSVLGLANGSPDTIPNPKPTILPSAQKPENKNITMGLVFIGAGLFLVVGAIYAAVKTSKSLRPPNDI